MKKLMLIFILIMSFSCGSTNNITEVGNATTTPKKAAVASATTIALTQATTSLLNISEATLLTKNVSLDDIEAFDCTFSILNKTLTCDCPEGGSFARSYDSLISFDEGELELDRTISTEFNDCMIETCGQTITLTGNTSGEMTGSYNTSSGQGAVSSLSSTSTNCTGLSSDDVDFGFEITLELANATGELSGSFCYAGESVDFDDVQDLKDTLDPDDECDDFGP